MNNHLPTSSTNQMPPLISEVIGAGVRFLEKLKISNPKNEVEWSIRPLGMPTCHTKCVSCDITFITQFFKIKRKTWNGLCLLSIFMIMEFAFSISSECHIDIFLTLMFLTRIRTVSSIITVVTKPHCQKAYPEIWDPNRTQEQNL